MKPPFEFGQVVFIARASSHDRQEIPCPVCYGKRRVTVILGNDEQVSIECEYCSHGCNPASGRASEWKPWSSVVETTVTGIKLEHGKWCIECAAYVGSDAEIFTTREAAEEARIVMFAAAIERAQACNHSMKYNGRKRLSWHVGYHRAAVRRAQHDLEYHGRKVTDLAKGIEA